MWILQRLSMEIIISCRVLLLTSDIVDLANTATLINDYLEVKEVFLYYGMQINVKIDFQMQIVKEMKLSSLI